MQERNYSFEELEAELLKRLKERGCTPVTINGYRYQCHGIFAKLKENGYESYSNEGGMKLLLSNWLQTFSLDLLLMVKRLHNTLIV